MDEGLTAEDAGLLRRENDLLLRMLDLGAIDDVAAFLRDALDVAVHASRAKHGYLAIFDENYVPGTPPQWSTSCGVDDDQLENIEAQISKGVIAHALETGEVVATRAIADPRFNARQSVRALKIDAVLCAPLGGSAGRGVLYLQGVEEGGLFTDADQRIVRTFATHLPLIVDNLLLQQRLKEDDPTVRYRKGNRFTRVAGRSRALATVLKRASEFAVRDAHLLITGPTGCGKTQLAREIHAISKRQDQPFVEVNCAAIPDSLFEAELFGATAGAFTDLRQDKVGRIEAAEGGTLLLDEVAEIPMRLQAKLLQFVQDRIYHRLGESQPRSADVRVIAATNIQLREAVRDGRFRSDLFHRLDVLRIRMPALAERTEDIPDLIEALGRHHSVRLGVPWPGAAPGAILRARWRDWDGNIRELSNHVERALAVSGGTRPLDEAMLFDEDDGLDHDPERGDGVLPLEKATSDFQRTYITHALDQLDGNRAKTARALQIARSTLYTLLDDLGIQKS